MGISVSVVSKAVDRLEIGHTIIPMVFVGPVGVNGRNATMTSTVQEIYDQIQTSNP